MRWQPLPPRLRYQNSNTVTEMNSITTIGKSILPYFLLLILLIVWSPACIADQFDYDNSPTETVITLKNESITVSMPEKGNTVTLENIVSGFTMVSLRGAEEIIHETGYGHQRKRDEKHPTGVEDLVRSVTAPTIDEPSSPRWPLADFAPPSTAAPLLLDEIPVVGPEAEILFHANESQAHVKTDAWQLPYNVCLEARFRLEGKRTRLLFYTCQMTEEGRCTLDKFTATDAPVDGRAARNQNFAGFALPDFVIQGPFGTMQVERCVQLHPWMFHRTPFAFHVKFVRRPRRFADSAAEERFMRRRRRRLGRRATRQVGHVTLKGFKECSHTCEKDPDTEQWLDNVGIVEEPVIARYDQIIAKRRKRRRLHKKVDK